MRQVVASGSVVSKLQIVLQFGRLQAAKCR